VADLAVSAGASSIAHGVHYTVLGMGLLALVWLLAPSRRAASDAGDDHVQRIAALRALVAAGELGALHETVAPPRADLPEATPRAAARTWLPLAVVSCAAAAGAHAAVGPAHFREKTVLGLFFAVAAAAQMGWSVAVAMRPSALLLRLGVAGNLALVALWALTRTAGLPGLAPEAVGAWDLACVTWELVAALACLHVLAGHVAAGTRVAGWIDWDSRARLWAYISIVGLGLLSISGAAS
jgi:hypothetical protein